MANIKIKMVQGDTAPIITFTIKRRGGSVINLTGATVRFKIDNEAGTRVNEGSDECVITDAAGGVCTYSWNDTDLDAAGTYLADLEITHSDGKIETAPDKYQITARAEV